MRALKIVKRVARYALVASYYAATWLVDLCARIATRRRKPQGPLPPYAPGVSVIVPERANCDLLYECLTAARASLARIAEPSEIVVVVNGSPRQDYLHLEALFPEARFIYDAEPAGFSVAVRRGLEEARFDWVYLLNNDMVLEPEATAEVLRWRAPHVFAVASQIFFRDPLRRREETGWTDFEVRDGWVTIFDVPPEDETVRGNFYAGGGASLFRKELLLRFFDDAIPYGELGYWEDVEWGARAWRCGFEVLFCPQSRAWHRHRATVSKFYSPERIEQLFRLNNFRFQMRNPAQSRAASNAKLFRWMLDVDGKSLRTLLALDEVAATLAARWRSFRDPFAESAWAGRRARFYPQAPGPDDRPLLIVVSPFAVFPPLHGGAVRIARLLRSLATRFRLILLSGEAERYAAPSLPGIDSVHLLPGASRGSGSDRISRIRCHSHAVLRSELERIIAVRRPAAVEIEYIELAKLAELRKASRIPWILTLHDVLLTGENNAADRYERALIGKFDAVIACSPEDLSLLAMPRAFLVPNGTDTQRDEYVSSRKLRRIGFAGPFRYAPNAEGIARFVARVFPELRRRVPGVELLLIGTGPFVAQDGIRVVGAVEDVGPYLRECALTINPISGARGSSLKVLESLALGRVCVSTANGARGYLDANLAGLVTVPEVDDMLEPLCRLLCEDEYRIGLEQKSIETVRKFDWQNSGRALLEVYEALLTV